MNKKLILKKVYTVSKKHDTPRIFLHHLVCEQASFSPGDDLYVYINEKDQSITIQNHKMMEETIDAHKISVSSRKNRTSGALRPLVDTAGTKFSSIINIQDKIEIDVYRLGDLSQVVVRPLRYRLFETETFDSPDERIRLLTICSGAGIGEASFIETGYYSSVQEVEMAEDCAEVIKQNFKYSYLFNGNLKDCNVVAKADVAFISLDCSEHSSIGEGDQGCFNNLVLGTYKILEAAQPRAIFSENVPAFYDSDVYRDLSELLQPTYPYSVGPLQIDSYDFGSIAHRKRGYTVFFKNKEDFDHFRIPSPPKFRRLKLREYLDSTITQHIWKPLDKWWASFNMKKEKGNSWAERNTEKTFVRPDCMEIQCIPARYRSHSASNSYVLSDDGTKWRFLTISELRRIFHIPSWFSFPAHTPSSRIYEMIGQSVCGKVIQSFANELCSMFFRGHIKKKVATEGVAAPALIRNQNGQLGFAF